MIHAQTGFHFAGKLLMNDTRIEEKVSATDRYPWYAYLLSGYALTGGFCWLLVARLFWQDGRRSIAALLTTVNTCLLGVMIWTALQCQITWWRLGSLTLVLNLIWAMSAWGTQYRLFGPAPLRYRPAQWRKWGVALLTGIILGGGLSICMAVVPAVGERITAIIKEESVGRTSVLWHFFQNLPQGLILGLLVGMWWAGCRRFTVSHVISFVTGIGTVLIAQMILYGLFAFIVHGANTAGMGEMSGDAWAFTSQRLHGLPRLLKYISDFDLFAIIPVGILFGAPTRIRDFLKRAAVITPLISIIVLPISFLSHGSWGIIQGQLVYQTASPDTGQQNSAFGWLQIMLARFPNHNQWPYLVERLANYQYERGQVDSARGLYQQIVDRFAASNRWHTQMTKARAILASPRFGDAMQGPTLDIPMVNYQDYLTQNWMALLSTVRYWQGPETPISELLIDLRSISKDDDEIKLPRLTGLNDLDDAAACLGYRSVILPAAPQAIRSLIESGIPVIMPVYETFYLLYGFDDSRGVVKALCFGRLSEKLKSLAVKETQEVLMLKKEGQGRTKELLVRIKREADTQFHLDQWRNGVLADAAPWIAVVCPQERFASVAQTMAVDPQRLHSAHQGRLAAFIALSFFDRADPVNCVRWSQIAARKSDEPLSRHTGYLGSLLWENRARQVGSAFQLEKQLTPLADIDQHMADPAVQDFLAQAREQFDQDRTAGRLNWLVRRRLLWLLDKHDTRQRQQMIALVKENLATYPADAKQWRTLADLHALNGDPVARTEALAQAWSADPADTKTAVAWAGALIRMDEPARADEILQEIDPAQVQSEAEYAFCLGAIAEWQGNPGSALRHYARATDLCRYRADYFIRYANLLKTEGEASAAEKALDWAARIDARDVFRQQLTQQ